ncbi:MAG: ABC transporter substrate-binding protein [Candidatus Omnitrophota bacterium]
MIAQNPGNFWPVLVLALSLSLFSACDQKIKAVGDPTQTQGITDTEILLGNSSPQSGHAQHLGTHYLRGAMVFFEDLNSRGGILGRKIRVISYDDQYDPSHCVLNTQKLIGQDKVFALFNYVGTPTTIKISPIVEESKIPLVGVFSGADVLRNPVKKYIFNIRSSYSMEVDQTVMHCVDDLGFKKLAVFYQNDAFGIDVLKGIETALKRYKLKPVVTESYERGTLNVERAAKSILTSGADAVIMAGLYSPCSKFVRLMKDAGSSMIFFSSSFVGAEEFAKELGEKDSTGVIISQVVPPPSFDVLSTVRNYKKLSKRYFPESQPDIVALEGFVNAKVIAEGLKRAGKDLSREKFVQALESLHDYSGGIGNPIDFSESNHSGLSYVFFTRIKNGDLVFFDDWQEIKNEMALVPRDI